MSMHKNPPHAAHREIPHCTPGRTSRRRWPRDLFSGNISCIRANRVIVMFSCFCYYYFLCVALPSPYGASNAVCTCVCRPSIAATGRQLRFYYTTHPPFALSSPPRRPGRERGIHCTLSFQQDTDTWGGTCCVRRKRRSWGGGCRWRRKLWTKGSTLDTTGDTHVYVDYVVLHLPPSKTLSSVRR